MLEYKRLYRLYWTIQGYIGLYTTIQDLTGLDRTMEDYTGMNMTIQDYDNTELYRTKKNFQDFLVRASA